ncbi:MAG: hypothetical protein A2857_02305 [Candidatus Levybacteria bacterium RIFCSPHIGHO2_01_FULL_36_15]|nr:MAG: hypothetical protein A2857_02305 [Candidatus Levybacteria bacterium RIFCSPHIGHO2_01_FULL_36_15]
MDASNQPINQTPISNLTPPPPQKIPPPPNHALSKIILLIFVLFIFIFIPLLIFQYSQYIKYTSSEISCGGDWSYNAKCPLGTYCKSLNQGPLAGGICEPYAFEIFNLFSPSGFK